MKKHTFLGRGSSLVILNPKKRGREKRLNFLSAKVEEKILAFTNQFTSELFWSNHVVTLKKFKWTYFGIVLDLQRSQKDIPGCSQTEYIQFLLFNTPYIIVVTMLFFKILQQKRIFFGIAIKDWEKYNCGAFSQLPDERQILQKWQFCAPQTLTPDRFPGISWYRR